jgi:DNA-binding response OmpR family regulator
MRILLIEDDEMIGQGLIAALRVAGLAVDWVRDGVAGEAPDP